MYTEALILDFDNILPERLSVLEDIQIQIT